MNSLVLFLYAFLGAVALNLADVLNKLTKKEFPPYMKRWQYWLLQLALGCLAGLVAMLYEPTTPMVAFFLGAATPTIIRQLAIRQESQLRDRHLESKLQAAEKVAEEQPQKVRPVWEVSRIQLELYIRRNQSQVNSIFWITVFVMLAGFALVGYGVFQAIQANRLDAAILTTSAGVMTEFIGATFLFIYRSTVGQAAVYVRTLERINDVGMAVQIVDAIADTDQETKNKARASLVGSILSLPRRSKDHGEV